MQRVVHPVRVPVVDVSSSWVGHVVFSRHHWSLVYNSCTRAFAFSWLPLTLSSQLVLYFSGHLSLRFKSNGVKMPAKPDGNSGDAGPDKRVSVDKHRSQTTLESSGNCKTGNEPSKSEQSNSPTDNQRHGTIGDGQLKQTSKAAVSTKQSTSNADNEIVERHDRSGKGKITFG